MKHTSRIAFVTSILALLCSAMFTAGAGAAQDGQFCEDRDVEAFNAIDVRDTGTVVVTQGDTPSISVCASSEDWLDLISTKVSSSELELQQDAGLLGEVLATATDANIVYNVTAPDLTHLHTDGTIEVTLDGFAIDILEVEMKGATKLILNGVSGGTLGADLDDASEISADGASSIDTLNLNVDDASKAHLFNLDVIEAHLETFEVTETEVRFTETLTVEAHTLSKVTYMTDGGSADIETHDLAKVEEASFVPLEGAPQAATPAA